MGVVDTSTSQGRNFCIRSPFGALNSSLEISIREIQLLGEKHQSTIHVAPRFSQKTSFRASKWPRKLKTAKNSKLPKLPETCFGPVGEGGWPPISTWISSMA
jgi:hypothetical protein